MELKTNLEKSVMDVIKSFEVKQGMNFEFFVSDDVTGIASFGCVNYFHISDICHDIFTNQPKGQIIDWLHECMGNPDKTINYQSYCMGLRWT